MWLEGSCFVLSSVAPDGRRDNAVIVRQAAYEDQSVSSARGGTKACVLLEISAMRLCGCRVVREGNVD